MKKRITIITIVSIFMLTGLTAISAMANSPPNKPGAPTPERVTKIFKVVTLYASTTDPDGDNIKYGFDWDGDGVIEDKDWTDYFESGETATCTNIYNKKGEYSVKVIAEDENGAQSEWSDSGKVTVKLTDTKSFYSFLHNLFEQFPNSFPIFRALLKL